MEKETICAKLEKVPIIPEVKFELPTVANEAEMLFAFCYVEDVGGLNWSEIVYRQHPKLREMVSGVKNKDEFYAKCYEYAEAYIIENRTMLEKTKVAFQESWGEVAELFLDNLSMDFEIDLPEMVKEIKANVSINPICPRHLDEWSFNVSYKFSVDRMKGTCIHEIIHFLYFKKWLEVFPDSDRKTFDSPHSEWRLSEILAPSIMNGNKAIQSIIKNNKSDVYRNWQSVVIDGKKLVDYFGDIYKEHEDGKISFADFLKKSWSEYKKYKDVIEGNNK